MDFYKFFLKRMEKRDIWQFILTFFTALVNNVAIVFTPVIQKRLLNDISIANMKGSDIVLLCLTSLMEILAIILEGIILNRLFIRLQRSLQRELLENAVRNDSTIIKAKGPGAYMVSVFGDSEHIAGLITTNIFGVLLQCVMAMVILFISLQWDYLFAYVVVPAYLLMILCHVNFDRKYMKYYQRGREHVYEINPKVLEYIENRGTMLAYSSLREYEEEMYNMFDIRDNCFKNASVINSLSISFNSAIKTVSMIVFFVLSLYKIQNNQLEVSTFIALVSYFGIIFQPISSIKGLYANLHKFRTMKEKIKSGLQEDLRLTIPYDDKLCFEECSMQYDGKECVNHFCLELDKKIGLVGLSGEGKTTLIKLLLGELKPTAGVCTYGTTNVSQVAKYVLRTMIRYYSQDIQIFDEDVTFNITVGKKGISAVQYEKCLEEQQKIIKELQCCIKEKKKPGSKKEFMDTIQNLFLVNGMQLKRKDVLERIKEEVLKLDDRMIEKISHILVSRKYYKEEKYSDLIKKLGLEKLEGRKLGQRGTKISGGEKNRIALARFLLPEYGEYFILDEPFTNLDLMAEAECLSLLKEYIKNYKGIIISHKLNVIKAVSDEIIVLENGTITERGTHESLVESGGLYQRLYRQYEKKI